MLLLAVIHSYWREKKIANTGGGGGVDDNIDEKKKKMQPGLWEIGLLAVLGLKEILVSVHSIIIVQSSNLLRLVLGTVRH